MHALKNQGRNLYAPDRGGRYSVWKDRPLRPELIQYAAADVKYLLDMKRAWGDSAGQGILDNRVQTASYLRMRTFVDSAIPVPEHQRRFREFEAIDGFNTTGNVTRTVNVPSNKTGLVIGKGGSTIKGLQASTNTQINLDNGRAMVYGKPADADRAVQRISSMVNTYYDYGSGGDYYW